jgi:hypothetical protein
MKQVIQIIGGPAVVTDDVKSATSEEESWLNVGIDLLQFTCKDTGIVYTVPAMNAFSMQYPE